MAEYKKNYPQHEITLEELMGKKYPNTEQITKKSFA